MSWALAPVAVVDEKNALELYATAEFMSVAGYSESDTKIKQGEIGAIVVVKNRHVVPILRIILKNS